MPEKKSSCSSWWRSEQCTLAHCECGVECGVAMVAEGDVAMVTQRAQDSGQRNKKKEHKKAHNYVSRTWAKQKSNTALTRQCMRTLTTKHTTPFPQAPQPPLLRTCSITLELYLWRARATKLPRSAAQTRAHKRGPPKCTLPWEVAPCELP